MWLAGLTDTGNIALNIGHENGHPYIGEALGEALQGHCFASTGSARNQAVAIGVTWVQKNRASVTAADKNLVAHGCVPLLYLWPDA